MKDARFNLLTLLAALLLAWFTVFGYAYSTHHGVQYQHCLNRGHDSAICRPLVPPPRAPQS